MFEETANGQGRLSGTLDMSSSGSLLATLMARIMRAPLQLDLSGINSADSSAIALLLACRRAAEQSDHALLLQNWPARLSELVELYALRELFSSPQGE
ncbi:MAG: STAS domain-containing protein [Aquitalea sp.]|nr:STAS domain-containing protein [Aquitalea sp.]